MIDTNELVRTKEAAVRQSTPLLQQAMSLQITNPVMYSAADTLRDNIKKARRVWKDRLELVRKPAYDALEAVYALIRDVDTPMKKGEEVITQKMAEYKREESRQIAAANAERDRLARDAEEARRKAESAQTEAVANLLKRKALAVEAKIEMATTVLSAHAENSSTRTVKMWRVVNLKALLAAIVAGDIPEDVIQINSAQMGDYFRGDDANKSMMRTWPGIEVYEDVQIASRRTPR